MVTLTPELAGNTLVVMIITYVVLLVYNIYMIYLSQRQAKVLEEIRQTNIILNEIKELLKKRGD